MYRDILVHVDNTLQCPERIAVAANLAKACRARLTGLYAVTNRFKALKPETGSPEAAEARQVFEKLTAEPGIAAEWLIGDWEAAGGTLPAVVNYHAHLKDLVVLGQPNAGPQQLDTPANLTERVVLESGRPVLVVPYAGSFPVVGERVMVCWRHGRESVRALAGAMPFLARAKQVRVIMIDPPGGGQGLGEGLTGPIAAYLDLHGIKAQVEAVAPAEISIGDMLLNESWEDSCDLLVMGAYMRTAQREVRTGPVARHLLQHMTLPVLMAH